MLLSCSAACLDLSSRPGCFPVMLELHALPLKARVLTGKLSAGDRDKPFVSHAVCDAVLPWLIQQLWSQVVCCAGTASVYSFMHTGCG